MCRQITFILSVISRKMLQKQKVKKKPRKRKPFSEKCDRSHRNDSKRVKEAAFGDVDLVLYTAANMAIEGGKEDLGYVLKQMKKHQGLAKFLKKELIKKRENPLKGLGTY